MSSVVDNGWEKREKQLCRLVDVGTVVVVVSSELQMGLFCLFSPFRSSSSSTSSTSFFSQRRHPRSSTSSSSSSSSSGWSRRWSSSFSFYSRLLLFWLYLSSWSRAERNIITSRDESLQTHKAFHIEQEMCAALSDFLSYRLRLQNRRRPSLKQTLFKQSHAIISKRTPSTIFLERYFFKIVYFSKVFITLTTFNNNNFDENRCSKWCHPTGSSWGKCDQ